jgi:hypothetical protein
VTIRVLFLGEGTSDSGITTHVTRILTDHGLEVAITDPLMDRLPPPPRKTVSAKLQAVMDLGGEYDLVVIHRDADRTGRADRILEIRSAVEQVIPDVPFAPVIPIRMTEAWLLLDESEIRRVAGNPNGKMHLGLPGPHDVESIPDPKELLGNVLAVASGFSGRRLEKFRKRFPQNRRLLLERIDPSSPIVEVSSWRAFNDDLIAGLECLPQSSRIGASYRPEAG